MSPSLRQALLTGGGILLFLVVAVLVWMGFRAAQAQDHLTEARRHLSTLQTHLVSGDADAANEDARVIREEASKAHSLTNGFLFRTVAAVPYFGDSTETARGLARASDELASEMLPQLVDMAVALSARDLRGDDGIDLGPLRESAVPLAETLHQIDDVRREVSTLPSGSMVIEPVEHARTALVAQVTKLENTVGVAARFALIAPGMLGDEGSRRYFVGVQDNAQARGTGGVLGAFAVLEARKGRVRLIDVGTASELKDARRPVADLGPGFTDAYGANAARHWSLSNQSPNFPDAAQIWAGLWERMHPRRPVDAVIGVDPSAYARILVATGPVQVSRKFKISAASVIRLTDVQARRDFGLRARQIALAGATSALIRNVLNGGGDAQRLATEFGRAAASRHLAVWSSQPAEQEVLEQTDYASLLPDDPRPFAELVVNNLAENKLDFFLHRSFNYFADDCSDTQRRATYVARLANEAPAHLPASVSGQTAQSTAPAAQAQLRVSLFVTAGTELESARLDGRPVDLDVRTERGHPVYSTELTIDRGIIRTLTVEATEPGGAVAPFVPVQPLLTTQRTIVDTAACR